MSGSVPSAGEWGVVRAAYGHPRVQQIAKVTPKLIKFAGLDWPRQCNRSDLLVSLLDKEAAEMVSQSLAGAGGQRDARVRKAQEEFAQRRAAAWDAYEKVAERMLETYPDMKQRYPLIEKGLTKAAVLAIVDGAGIALPPMYALGFHNNNCIPCVKATSPSYWALVRKEFPEQFERMVKLSRELNVRLVILGREKVDGKVKNIRGFIDEIPLDQPTTNPIAPACDFLCHHASQDLAA